MKMMIGRLVLILITTQLLSSCELFSTFEKRNTNILQQTFVYENNNTSWTIDFVETKLNNFELGYYVLIQESYTPNAYSLLKLDKAFNLIWKQTFEFSVFKEITELQNGDILLSGERRTVIVHSDGLSYSEFTSQTGQEMHSLRMNSNLILFYGIDIDYKGGFLAGYDSKLNKLWERKIPYNPILTVDTEGIIYSINALADSITRFDAKGSFMGSVETPQLNKFIPVALKVNENGEYIILGIKNFSDCCCNDDITLVKVSPNGQLIWGQTIGNPKANDYASSLIIADDFYAITGAYGESDCRGPGFDGNYHNIYTVKFSTSGKVIKQYSLGSATTEDGLSKIIESEGQYLVAGRVGDKDLSAKATIFKLIDF
jgi:hypothetical protein